MGFMIILLHNLLPDGKGDALQDGSQSRALCNVQHIVGCIHYPSELIATRRWLTQLV